MKTKKFTLLSCLTIALVIFNHSFNTIKASSMLDHVSIAVKNYAQSVQFYDEILKILGYTRLMTFEFENKHVAGYGINGKPSFWISDQGNEEETIGKARGVHFAFAAPNRPAVDAWYAKALELGGTDNGKPGLRPQYHPNYYGAFIIDPNGWRIEAACHSPAE